MRGECIQAVAQAMGRSISEAESRDIEQTINNLMKQLARKDPVAWHQMSRDERLHAAAAEAGQGMLADVAKHRQRVALTIIAHDRMMNRYGSLLGEGLKPFGAVARVLDDASRFTRGVSNEYFSGLIDTLNAVHPRMLGMVEDARQAADLVSEIFGKPSGNKLAAKGAKAWLDTVEAMRQRFNAAGGDVGKLDYGYLPQPHDDARVLKAGQNRWTTDILPLLDRSRYVDADGVRLNDAQMTALLGEAWETITTGGFNKVEPGKSAGFVPRADRGSSHRAIHFKDAESYLTYAKSYHRGGVLAAMQGHVSRLARDIALVEEFGPNPELQFRFLHDTARKTGKSDLVGPYFVRTVDMWDVLTGKTGRVVNVTTADRVQAVRNIEVFGKLGGAFISSLTDIPTYFVTTGFNRLGFVEPLINLVRSLGKDSTEYANRAGLVADSIVSDMNRWAEGNIGKGWSGKIANATMKASLLEGWTDAVRRAFSVTMMGALGKISRSDWAALEAGDRWRLERQGVTETDFKVWQLATPEDWRGSQMLTLQAVRGISEAQLQAAGLSLRDQHRAVSRLLGSIADESEFASLSQDLNTRAAVTRGTQKGTFEGEFFRTLALFKGFPMAMISRHWGRMADQWRAGDKASSVAYGAALTTGLTVFGAITLQLNDLREGRDPRDMTTAKFWMAAAMKGGGLGIFGDLLYTGLGGESRAGIPAGLNVVSSLAGPVVGSAVETFNLGNNVRKMIVGEQADAGADALRLARSHAPFINLWYAKSAIDHAVLQDMQEYLSPGYLRRMRQRAHRDWGQDFWWRPGESAPDRAPDMSRATGR